MIDRCSVASIGLAAAILLTVPMTTPGTAGADPVVIELFTSQGCSSCPPADRLLSRLADSTEDIVPLAYHVDYWNYIGWTDPFSSEAWSNRQRRYARAFDAGRIYTPQMVFDGRADCVGSDAKEVRRLLAEAAARQAEGDVEFEITQAGDGLSLAIAAGVQQGKGDGEWTVMVAVYEDGLVTSVPRGENAGRELANGRVVRSLSEAFSLPARRGAESSGTLDIEIGDDWRRDRLGVAVFLQDPETMHIHGAAVRRVDG